MKIYLDIETIPEGEPDLDGLVDPSTIVVMHDDPGISPDKRLKDSDKIAEDIERRRTKLQDMRRQDAQEAIDKVTETWRKGSLSAIGGRVLCVGIAVDEGGPVVIWEDSEEKTLAKLERGLMRYQRERPTITTWNGNGFDRPYLARRALRYKLYDLARICRVQKKWDAGDLYMAWGMGDMRAKGKLDDVCDLLGISRAGNPIAGSEVLDRYLAGDREAIIDHCIDDVRVLQLIGAEFSKAGWL